MDIILFLASGLFVVLGIIGAIMPGLPGAPLSYIGLLLLHFTSKIQYSVRFLVIMLLLVIAVQILDYVVPGWCTKKFGGSRKGVIGSIIGLFVGLFAPIPYGFIIGPFLGAVIGELIEGRNTAEALKSGLGSFVGFILSTGVKLALGISFAVFYVKAVIEAI